MTHDDRLIDVDGVRRWAGPGELVVFAGVATGGSRSHHAFPAWAATLGRPAWTLRGLDLPPTTPAPAYAELVEAIVANPRVAGAVVTSHKLRLFRAATGRFRRTDALTTLMHEVNTLVRAGDGVDAHARDPLALAAVLRDRPAPRDVVVYGAGGAGTALLLALTLDVEATLAAGAPVRGGAHRVTVLDTDEAALAALRTTAERCGVTERLTLLDARTPAPIPTGALVVNATGLGKDRPGSPLPPGAVLPATATAWDFNYRGDLTFLADARASGAAAVDGWDYFVAGWGAALTAIAGVPFTAELLAGLAAAVSRTRR